MGIKDQTNFWKKKKVFITGHTGFKGSWLTIWLNELGANIKGYALAPNTLPSLFKETKISDIVETEIGDIRDLEKLKKSILDFQPDVLVHLAAQPLVNQSYIDPVETYTTNIIGTVNVLEAARHSKNLRALVSVTSDKCYENKEWLWGYRESDPMGGFDPYSSSKGCAELITNAYRKSFFKSRNQCSISSVRAGNVIGGGDWTNGRLIPDIIKALNEKSLIKIRNPNAIRPWQHVLDPLSGYMTLAKNLYEKGDEFAEAWNFGPHDGNCKSVLWIIKKINSYTDNNLEYQFINDESFHEAKLLKLDSSKANTRLNWRPKWNLDHTLKEILNWNLEFKNGTDVYSLCKKTIENYTN